MPAQGSNLSALLENSSAPVFLYTPPPVGDFDPTDGTWYWINTTSYGGPGGCVGDNVFDNKTNLQAVLTAAANASPRKKVYVPPGTYYFNPTVNIPSNTVMRGAGQDSSLFRSSRADGANGAPAQFMFEMSNTSGSTIRDLAFYSNNYAFGAAPYWFALFGSQNITMQDFKITNGNNCIKTGNYSVLASNLTISGYTAVHCERPLYLADMTNAHISDSHLDAVSYAESGSNQTHGVYIERNVTYTYFDNVHWTGGSGYCLHLYCSSSGNTGSHHIYFTNCIVDARLGRRTATIQVNSAGLPNYAHIYFDNCQFPGQVQNNSSAAMFICVSSTDIHMTNITAGPAYRFIYAGAAPCSVTGTFTGTTVGTVPSVWDTSGLTHIPYTDPTWPTPA